MGSVSNNLSTVNAFVSPKLNHIVQQNDPKKYLKLSLLNELYQFTSLAKGNKTSYKTLNSEEKKQLYEYITKEPLSEHAQNILTTLGGKNGFMFKGLEKGIVKSSGAGAITEADKKIEADNKLITEADKKIEAGVDISKQGSTEKAEADKKIQAGVDNKEKHEEDRQAGVDNKDQQETVVDIEKKKKVPADKLVIKDASVKQSISEIHNTSKKETEIKNTTDEIIKNTSKEDITKEKKILEKKIEDAKDEIKKKEKELEETKDEEKKLKLKKELKEKELELENLKLKNKELTKALADQNIPIKQNEQAIDRLLERFIKTEFPEANPLLPKNTDINRSNFQSMNDFSPPQLTQINTA